MDPSGAVVPNATVRLAGSETGNTLRTIETNGLGVAAIPLVPPGAYDITVTMAGFKAAVRKAVPVSAGSVLDLTIALETGNATESVTITSTAPLLEEKSATLAQVVNEKQLIELPLNGRNYLSLANLTAGAIPSSGSRDQTSRPMGIPDCRMHFCWTVDATRTTLRGLDNRARDMIRPPLDALSEFTVQTSNFSAEFGAAAGGVVNAVTKSGTNAIHGSAYEFLRNDNLDARNFSRKRSRCWCEISTAGPLEVRSCEIRRGSSARTRVCTTAMRRRARSDGTSLAQRAGNFGSTPIFDPATTRVNPNGTGIFATCSPATSSRQHRLNPLGLNMLNSLSAAEPVPDRATSSFGTFLSLPTTRTAWFAETRRFPAATRCSAVTQLHATGCWRHRRLPDPAQSPVDRYDRFQQRGLWVHAHPNARR